MKKIFLLLYSIAALAYSCSGPNSVGSPAKTIHEDTPFMQDYSIRYYSDPALTLKRVACDRNGYIQVLSSEGLLRTHAGTLLSPGTLIKDRHYRPVADKNISGLNLLLEQLIYVDDKAVLSNAWAGRVYCQHTIPGAKMLSGSPDFSFMVSDGKKLQLVRESVVEWEGELADEEVRDIRYDKAKGIFYILGNISLNVFYPVERTLEKIPVDTTITCIGLTDSKIVAGTASGYFEIDKKTPKQPGQIHGTMPWNDLTAVREINGHLWFGSKRGAMMLKEDGRFNYYASERWLPSDTVVDIAAGPGSSVLILTTRGLSKICFNEITLHDKAMLFEKQVRERHIRHGFNSTLSGMKKGDLTSGSLEDSDNDGLWTSMYLAAETFRYAVDGSDEALENIRESLDAMERLYTINPVSGFPARSFERRGYKYKENQWRRAADPEWDWKSTTSSDEAIGHIFAFGVIAELITVPEIKDKAIMLIDTLMSHILGNNLYLVDWDGNPTRWGRWNPEYVNSLQSVVGDRKLNSSNIIAMLQTAYHFTGKDKYRDAAFMLMDNHGYLSNMMKPMIEIGVAPENSDELGRLLSDSWNHSDDEMYYCGYWGLYRYAFNDTLRENYRRSIIDHWEAERPEKDGLWNIMTALTGAEDIDLEEAIWYLQEYPVDLINWKISNSHRKDIEKTRQNFRNQSTSEVLPPDELPVSRHNANRFTLDGGVGGTEEMSAGDIWLLPYWMGRYFGLISAGVDNNIKTLL
jgi:hypothetical protein